MPFDLESVAALTPDRKQRCVERDWRDVNLGDTARGSASDRVRQVEPIKWSIFIFFACECLELQTLTTNC
jgi:hypothetical protein